MPLPASQLADIVTSLARRPGHEQVRVLVERLLTDGLGVARIDEISHEVRLIEAGRIDALLGRTILEYKKDLRRELRDAERGLKGYLTEFESRTGERHVGVATDGANWRAYALQGDDLVLLRETKAEPRDPNALLLWLDGAVAAREDIPPDAENVIQELGGDSIAYQRARSALTDAWAAARDQPTPQLQRQLWAQMLRLVYGQDVDDDGLWVQHTYLVIVGKAIAAHVLGVRTDDPAEILSGRPIAALGIAGAVESDFFDWVLAAPGGPDLVRRLLRHVSRFRLHDVETDVLKVLYESLIDRDQRFGLGEYYTPDWLAKRVIERATLDQLDQRILDPACGSGTFIFHAVRHHLKEAEEAGVDPRRIAQHCADHVAGIDIHPVAVIIARITFLLAVGPALAARSGVLAVPIYLGDALQLNIRHHFTETELVVRVPPPPEGAPPGAVTSVIELAFPGVLCRIGPLFDQVVIAMRTAAEGRLPRDAFLARIGRIVADYDQQTRTILTSGLGREVYEAVELLGPTYDAYLALVEADRDTIWSYVARNQARPLAVTDWAHVMVGNPPWLTLRSMNPELQRRFSELARGERVYEGGRFRTHNNLCALFMARAAGLYLRPGGRLAMVLPHAVLTRGQFARLRTGAFTTSRLRFEEAWDLDEVEPLFPVPACVLFARRGATARATPEEARYFKADFSGVRNPDEALAERRLKERVGPAPSETTDEAGSAYKKRFRQGATLVPRMLTFVERKSVGMLGSNASAPLVVSRRGPLDKAPWNTLPSLEYPVEAEFLRPVLLGESVAPYRLLRVFEAVVPVTAGGEIVDASSAAKSGLAGLHDWLRDAEAVWDEHSAGKLTLSERWNYHGLLLAQVPTPERRVVFAASGNSPAACVIGDAAPLVEHKLYWSAIRTDEEGRYLVAVLNSETARSRVEARQSKGLFGARDFDKLMLDLPIPNFDPAVPLHAELAEVAETAEAVAASVAAAADEPFTRVRSHIRAALRDDGVAARIDDLVTRLLDG